MENSSTSRKVPVSVIDGTKLIYVTIGVSFSRIPLVQKASIFVELEKETPVQAAKRFRRTIATNIETYGWSKGPNFQPSDLYYELYDAVDDSIPLYCSANAPSMKEAC